MKIKQVFAAMNNRNSGGKAAGCVFCLQVGMLLTLPALAGDELTLGGSIALVERTVEQNVEETVAQSVQESVQETVEEAVTETLEEQALTLGGAWFEATIEKKVEESVQDSVEASVEATVEDTVAEDVTEEIEEDIEEAIAQDIEESITDTVEESVEVSVSETVEEAVAQNVEGAVEEGLAATVEDTLEENVEEGLSDSLEQGVEEGLSSGIEEHVAGNVEDKLDSEIDEILEQVESGLEVDERRIQRGQWLVMAEPEVFDELAREGYLFDEVTDLPGMGLRLAEVAAPSSFNISEVRQGVVDVVGSDRAEVDLNHIYTAGEPEYAVAEEDGLQPRAAIEFPADIDDLSLRIGMIDSRVDVSHPSLRGTHITSRSFVPEGAELPSFHGTAIASIIAADGEDYRGLAPRSEVYAASVFQQDPERGEFASTVSLVRALDWLMSSGVDVVNISLAGPPNRLLEAALKRAAERDVTVLAAAGNGGPVAQPMYPAAYDSVVAVTAVDASGQVFRLANRGGYLDLSAPGVGMLHARAGGGYAASSGTSFAVPFAATAAARLRQVRPGENVLELLIRSAEDLGPPGRDDIYGYGLLRPANS